MSDNQLGTPVQVAVTLDRMRQTLINHLGQYEHEVQQAIEAEVGDAFAAFDFRAAVRVEVERQLPQLIGDIVRRAVNSVMYSTESRDSIERMALDALDALRERERER